jgi:hypothetical protein
MKALKIFTSLALCLVITTLIVGCGGTQKSYNPSPILFAKEGKVYLIGIADNFDIIDPRTYFGKYNGYDFNITEDFKFFGEKNKSFSRKIEDLSFAMPESFDLEATVDHFQWLFDDETPTLSNGETMTNDYVGVAGGWKKIPRKTKFVDDREILSDLNNDGKKDTLTLAANLDDPKRININLTMGNGRFESFEMFETKPSEVKISAVADLNGDGCMEIIMTYKTDETDVITIYTTRYAGKEGFIRQARFEYYK